MHCQVPLLLDKASVGKREVIFFYFENCPSFDLIILIINKYLIFLNLFLINDSANIYFSNNY